MISIVKASLRLKESHHLARFEEALRDPRAAQARVLEGLVAANRDTRFGREHGFAEVRTAADYARRVPLRDYEAFRPYVDRIVAGEEGVLTHAPVVMFTTTSGTTNLPKLVPVTAAWSEQMASLTRLWMLARPGTIPRASTGRSSTWRARRWRAAPLAGCPTAPSPGSSTGGCPGSCASSTPSPTPSPSSRTPPPATSSACAWP